MHPAKSVIYFTTASGAGYGLFILSYVFSAFFAIELRPGLGVGLMGTAFFLIVTGLLSSTFHLGHPERIFRALTQWRSSWLSREGIFSLLFFPPGALFTYGWIWHQDVGGLYKISGGIAALLALLTVFSTGKIYSTLKAIPAWSHPLTVPVYVLLSIYSGGILYLPIGQLWFVKTEPLAFLIVMVSGFLAMGAKLFYWRAVKVSDATETASGATGLKGKVTLLESPHDQKNYLMKEMGYQIARKHAEKLRYFSLGFLFLIPIVATFLAAYSPKPDMVFGWMTVSVFLMIPGIMIERWLFFAEAKHLVTLYYGEKEI